MAKEGWKVKAIAVTITADGKRVERPFSDFSPEERRVKGSGIFPGGRGQGKPQRGSGRRKGKERGDGLWLIGAAKAAKDK